MKYCTDRIKLKFYEESLRRKFMYTLVHFKLN